MYVYLQEHTCTLEACIHCAHCTWYMKITSTLYKYMYLDTLEQIIVSFQYNVVVHVHVILHVGVVC